MYYLSFQYRSTDCLSRLLLLLSQRIWEKFFATALQLFKIKESTSLLFTSKFLFKFTSSNYRKLQTKLKARVMLGSTQSNPPTFRSKLAEPNQWRKMLGDPSCTNRSEVHQKKSGLSGGEHCLKCIGPAAWINVHPRSASRVREPEGIRIPPGEPSYELCLIANLWPPPLEKRDTLFGHIFWSLESSFFLL